MTDWNIVPRDDGSPASITVEHLDLGWQGDRRTIRRKVTGIPEGRTLERATFTVKRKLSLTAPALFTKTITTDYVAGRGKIDVVDDETFVEFELRSANTALCYPRRYWDCDLILDDGSSYSVGGKAKARRSVSRVVEVGSIVVTPDEFSILDSEEIQLEAAVYDDNGVLMPDAEVVWGSSAAGVATVGASTGLVVGQAAGDVLITATCDGIAGTSEGTITFEFEVERVEIDDGDFAVFIGDTRTPTATVYAPGDVVLTGRVKTWLSSDPAVATVHPTTGLVTGIADGSCTLTVTCEGHVDTVTVNVLQEWTAIHMDTDGHSLMARGDGSGGTPWLTWTEQIAGMLDAPVTYTRWAVNGRAISQMLADLPGQARPAKPAGTLKCRVSTEVLNQFIFAGSTLEQCWALIEEYCLAVMDLGYYDRHFYILSTPGGYNRSSTDWIQIDTWLKAGVSRNVVGAHPIGTSLGVTCIDLRAESPLFGTAGGLKRGTLLGSNLADNFEEPDGTNAGGILSYEVANQVDASGVHWTSSGHSLCARIVAEYLNANLAIPLLTPDEIRIEYQNPATGDWLAMPGGGVPMRRGKPTGIRAKSYIAGVEQPTLLACVWRTNANGDCSSPTTTEQWVTEPNVVEAYLRTDGAAFQARCGKVTQAIPIAVSGTGHIVAPELQRLRCNWNTWYGLFTDAASDADQVAQFDPRIGIVTTGGAHVNGQNARVGERVTSWTDAFGISGLNLTVPGGSVGPILRSAGSISIPQIQATIFGLEFKYYLEFDSVNAKLESALTAALELSGQLHIHADAEFNEAVGGTPRNPIMVTNAAGTELMSINTDTLNIRGGYVHPVHGTGYVNWASPYDRIAGSGVKFAFVNKLLAGSYHIQASGALSGTGDFDLGGNNYSNADKKLVLGGAVFKLYTLTVAKKDLISSFRNHFLGRYGGF